MKDNKDKNRIPIIVGNYSPFRLVLSEGDKWAPTLDDINNNTYDYVKLHRISAFVDVGIAPFSLIIGYDGSLILPALPKYNKRETAMEAFNEVLGIMLLGGVYSEAVSPLDVSFGTLSFEGYYRCFGGADGPNARFHNAIQTKFAGIVERMSLLNPQTITDKEITEAYKKGKTIYSKLDKFSTSLLMNGASYFVKHQWMEALVSIWTSIEQLINLIWQNEIIADVKNSESKIEGRTKFLKDFRTWTTSAKIELLFQKEYLSTGEYKLLNIVRRSRNDFIHEGYLPNQEIITQALEVLFKIISLIVTEYKNNKELDSTFEIIVKNQRGQLFPKKKTLDNSEVTHWIKIPPIPGDNDWVGDYEVLKGFAPVPIKNQ